MIGIRLQKTELTYNKGQNAAILNVIDKLKEVKYFNKLDLIWGYTMDYPICQAYSKG